MKDMFDTLHFYDHINFMLMWFIVVEKLIAELFGDGDLNVPLFLSIWDTQILNSNLWFRLLSYQNEMKWFCKNEIKDIRIFYIWSTLLFTPEHWQYLAAE